MAFLFAILIIVGASAVAAAYAVWPPFGIFFIVMFILLGPVGRGNK